MSADILPRRAKGLRRGGWISVAFVAILLAFGGSFFTYHAYCRWQGERAIREARSFLENNDAQNSILSLRTALRYCPHHFEALRAIASLLESAHSSEALAHRRTLMDVQPQLLEPKLAYARTALLLDRPEEAGKVLERVKGANRKTPQFLELRAEFFLARGRADLALEAYRELFEWHPENRRAQVKLTALELQSGLEQAHDAARAEMESLANDDEFGLIALRALTHDALRRQDHAAALSWSARACEMPRAEFSDRLQQLQALSAAKSAAYERGLIELERSALEHPEFTAQLGKWKLSAAGPQSAAMWLESAPGRLRREPAISLLLAECYSALARWSDLESLTSPSGWQEFEAVRLALLSRAQARQGNLKSSEQAWQLALAAAERQPTHLDRLLLIAKADKRDVRQVLWIIAEKDPRHISARKELYQAYWYEKNADGMLRMMELVLKENPGDRAARYNVASLLMATGRQIQRAGRLAQELYEDDPDALANTALYAFALSLLGNPKKGADMLDSRKDLERLSSEGTAYYTLVLSACGRVDEARRLLGRIDRELLVPELRASLDRVFGTVSANTTAIHLIQE